MTNEQLYEKFGRHGLDPVAIEALRDAFGRMLPPGPRFGPRVTPSMIDAAEADREDLRSRLGGHFVVEHTRREGLIEIPTEELRDMIARGFERELPRMLSGEPYHAIEPAEAFHNVVTNQGMNYLLDAGLSGATPITAWYGTLFTSNTTPLVTHTYGSPAYTEVTDAQLSESARQAYTDAGASSQQLTNTASPYVFTAATTITVYGSAIVGGGTDPTVLEDTAGGGTYYAGSQYATSKAMVSTDTLSTTYVLGLADDDA